MLSHDISGKILSVGANWKRPGGGVAQVMANYAEYIFGQEHFDCVVNSTSGSNVKKLAVALNAFIRFSLILTFKPSKRIIHIHTASYNSFRRSALFGTIAKLFHRKLIYHIHGGGFKGFYATNPVKIKKALDKANCIIALSPSWGVFFKSILPDKRIEIVNNLIPPPKKQLICTQKIATPPIQLLFLGKICKDKGIYDLIDVLYQNKAKFADKIHLHIGGNGESDKLQHLIIEKGLSDIITFHGWISGEKKAELFTRCHYYILPSYTEGQPLSIAEAMSYGLPVIATRVGGIPEMIDNDTGFLFEAGDKNGMNRIITSLADNKDSLLMSSNAIRKALDFQPDRVKTVLENIYRTLLSSK